MNFVTWQILLWCYGVHKLKKMGIIWFYCANGNVKMYLNANDHIKILQIEFIPKI